MCCAARGSCAGFSWVCPTKVEPCKSYTFGRTVVK